MCTSVSNTTRHQKLQYRPPLEEIRAKYYREMKKFICIPLFFRGVGEAASPADTIFPRMINRNAPGFSVVYRKVGVTLSLNWCCMWGYYCTGWGSVSAPESSNDCIPGLGGVGGNKSGRTGGTALPWGGWLGNELQSTEGQRKRGRKTSKVGANPISKPFHFIMSFFRSVINIDCITVSTLPTKATIDNHIQQLFDALLSQLRKSISSHLQVSYCWMHKI